MTTDTMELIPEGRYEAKLVEADVTRDPRHRLKLKFEISEGLQKGRPLWLTLGVHSNPTLLVDVKHREWDGSTSTSTASRSPSCVMRSTASPADRCGRQRQDRRRRANSHVEAKPST